MHIVGLINVGAIWEAVHPNECRHYGQTRVFSGRIENYEWLGGKDSNLDKQIQSLPSYHWTTPHQK